MASFACLEQFRVHEVHDHIGPAIQQHDMATDQDVRAIGRGRRQVANQYWRAGLNLLWQSWRQRTAAHQLLFKSRRQAVLLRKAWGKIVGVLAVPVVNIFVVAVVVALIAVSLVVAVLVVAFAVSMTLA